MSEKQIFDQENAVPFSAVHEAHNYSGAMPKFHSTNQVL
jgi:hypothetical protein